LIVVVPFAAFRSLASEREDNTYDLLSITALKPRQIISGKLGSAVVQMAVYFSVITPCIAFTYLLRGVDVPTILVLIGYTFFASLGLSMVAILLATLSEQRFAQVFVSVALVAFLLWAFFMSVLAIGAGFVQFSYSFVCGDEFWIRVLALATFYVTTRFASLPPRA
jgi:ABC-type transport system involved in multi-copper enzyme maturation permease subunit